MRAAVTVRGMTALRLTRSAGDRRLYELEGIGSMRSEGWLSRSALAEAGEHSWRFAADGLFKRVYEARDGVGAVVGRFEGTTWGRGGTLVWAGTEMALQHRGVFHHRYILCGGHHELAMLDGSGYGKLRCTSRSPWARSSRAGCCCSRRTSQSSWPGTTPAPTAPPPRTETVEPPRHSRRSSGVMAGGHAQGRGTYPPDMGG